MNGAGQIEFAGVTSAIKEIARRLAADGAATALVTGPTGSGKSTVLTHVRKLLLRDGVIPVNQVLGCDSETDIRPLLIDDADTLGDEQIDVLRALVEDARTSTVIVAAADRNRPAIRKLFQSLERESQRIALTAVDAAEIATVAPELAGLADEIIEATAGLPALVTTAMSHTTTPEPLTRALQAVDAHISEVIRRLDPLTQDTVLLLSLDPTIGSSDIAAVLALSAQEASDRVDAAVSSGLVATADQAAFAGRVHRCASRAVGAVRHFALERSVLRAQLETDSVSTRLACTLAAHGLRDPQLAQLLVSKASDESDPVAAAALLRASLTAGASPDTVGTPLADALARGGDLHEAVLLTDEMLSRHDAREHPDAVRVAAAIACHNGDSSRAARLQAWLGAGTDGVTALLAAPALIGTGRLTDARDAFARHDVPPTTWASAFRGGALGLLASVEGRDQEALELLSRAAMQPQPPYFAPDSIAALAALTMMHSGEPERARDILMHSVHPHGFATRHHLLLGWLSMLSGDLDGATAALPQPGTALSRRDALFAEALHAGIARRRGDTGELRLHWQAAIDMLASYSIDLYTLLPIGELWVAAARLRTAESIRRPVERAFQLLKHLGEPITWSASLHWAGVHAAILANAPDRLVPHAQALAAAAESNRHARILAMSGRIWLHVLANEVNAEEVENAARMLVDTGLGWDATRLAGQAALNTGDAKVSASMLALARTLRPPSTEVRAPGSESAATTAAATGRPSRAQLSDREREVATLLLRGLPYRDIGAQLFISAKTVEHHVARIRRRLGAESRSDMLSMLRTMVDVD